jgi:hypothetical protein
MNHDNIGNGNQPDFEKFTLSELNERFGSNYSSVDEATNADPEYLYDEQQMLEFICE